MAVRITSLLLTSPIGLPNPVDFNLRPKETRVFTDVEYDKLINDPRIRDLLRKKAIRILNLDDLTDDYVSVWNQEPKLRLNGYVYWVDATGAYRQKFGDPTHDLDGFIIGPGGAPIAHAGTHEDEGVDEIDVADLSGVLADPQPPIMTAAVPTTVNAGDSSSPGTATGAAARPDHEHGVATAAPIIVTGGTNTEGSSTSLARADHQHALGGPPAGGSAPGSPSNGDLWFNATAGWQVLMVYDGSRSKWLSTSEYELGLGRDSADGNYLRGFGITGAAGVGTGVLMPRDATIKRMTAHSRAGLATKSFDLLIDDVSALSFSLTANNYTNNTADIDVDEGERVWVSASAIGARALDVVVAIWVSWRV